MGLAGYRHCRARSSRLSFCHGDVGLLFPDAKVGHIAVAERKKCFVRCRGPVVAMHHAGCVRCREHTGNLPGDVETLR